MYAPFRDPYTYRGTTVLKNIPGIRDGAALELFETAATAVRSGEPLPSGRLGVRNYKAIHRHLFQDVYPWAGRLRKVRISRGESTFCYPENIPQEMVRIFAWLKVEGFLRGRSRSEFATGAAHFLSELNAIYPFSRREWRTQLTFMALVAARADFRLRLDRLKPDAFLAATIASFHGDETRLVHQFRSLVN